MERKDEKNRGRRETRERRRGIDDLEASVPQEKIMATPRVVRHIHEQINQVFLALLKLFFMFCKIFSASSKTRFTTTFGEAGCRSAAEEEVDL